MDHIKVQSWQRECFVYRRAWTRSFIAFCATVAAFNIVAWTWFSPIGIAIQVIVGAYFIYQDSTITRARTLYANGGCGRYPYCHCWGKNLAACAAAYEDAVRWVTR